MEFAKTGSATLGMNIDKQTGPASLSAGKVDASPFRQLEADWFFWAGPIVNL